MSTNLETVVKNAGKELAKIVEAILYGGIYAVDAASLIQVQLDTILAATKAEHLELEKHVQASNKGAQTNAIVNQIVTKTNIELQDEIDVLKAEMKELERDKARLDKAELCGLSFYTKTDPNDTVGVFEGSIIVGEYDSLRESIDAAQLPTEKEKWSMKTSKYGAKIIGVGKHNPQKQNERRIEKQQNEGKFYPEQFD